MAALTRATASYTTTRGTTQTPNALIGRVANQGGPGKRRKHRVKRLGRRRADALADEEAVPLDEELLGKAVTLYLQLLRKGCKKRAAYDAVYDAYYSRVETGLDASERVVDKYPGATPSERVIWYRGSLLMPKEQGIQLSTPSDKFNLENRPATGTPVAGVFRPGSQYQLDSTPYPVNLRSAYDATILIGTPNVYFAVDSFSHAIVSARADLGANSAHLALLAMRDAFRDKSAAVASLGQPPEHDFPMRHMCDQYLFDRDPGNLAGKIEAFLEPLGIRRAVTPTARADLKPIVETVNNSMIAIAAERHPILKHRGSVREAHDLNGVLTLEQFREYLLLAVLQYNHTTEVRRLPRGIMRDDTFSSPSRIWQRGCELRGAPTPGDPNRIKFVLLPRRAATLNDDGILVRETDLHYRAMKGSDISHIRYKGRRRRSFTLLIDPDHLEFAWIDHGHGKYEMIELQEDDAHNFAHMTLWEAESYWQERRRSSGAGKDQNRAKRATLRRGQRMVKERALLEVGGIVAAHFPKVSQELRRMERDAGALLAAETTEEPASGAPYVATAAEPDVPSPTIRRQAQVPRASGSPGERLKAAHRKQLRGLVNGGSR